MVSTVALQQEGSGFNLPKEIRLTGYLKLLMSLNVVRLCVIAVIDAQDVPRHLAQSNSHNIHLNTI